MNHYCIIGDGPRRTERRRTERSLMTEMERNARRWKKNNVFKQLKPKQLIGLCVCYIPACQQLIISKERERTGLWMGDRISIVSLLGHYHQIGTHLTVLEKDKWQLRYKHFYIR